MGFLTTSTFQCCVHVLSYISNAPVQDWLSGCICFVGFLPYCFPYFGGLLLLCKFKNTIMLICVHMYIRTYIHILYNNTYSSQSNSPVLHMIHSPLVTLHGLVSYYCNYHQYIALHDST